MSIKRVRIQDFSPELIREYLSWLGHDRHCGVSTKNQRLAALRAFFKYVKSKARSICFQTENHKYPICQEGTGVCMLPKNLYSQPLNAVWPVFFPAYRVDFPCHTSVWLRKLLVCREKSSSIRHPSVMNTGSYFRMEKGRRTGPGVSAVTAWGPSRSRRLPRVRRPRPSGPPRF